MSGQFVPKYLFPSKHPALFWWRCINQNNAKKEGPERPASEGPESQEIWMFRPRA